MRWIWLMAIIALLSLSGAVFAACTPGDTKECVTAKDCPGTRVCLDSEWSDCELEQVCEPGERDYCVPLVNGEDCYAFKSAQECSKCGDYWGECEIPSGVECCPGQSRVCDVSGEQECKANGQWDYCFDGDSCENAECDDGEACTEDRCALGECVFPWIEGCCLTDADCSLDEECRDGNCAQLNCGECFEAESHECIDRKKGMCCNGHWNDGYSSCEFNYSVTEEKVLNADDERSDYFFGKGIDALDTGFLEQARQYFKAAELAAAIAKAEGDFNSEVLELIYGKLESIDEAVEERDFSKAEVLGNSTRNLFKLKKPVEVDLNAEDANNIVLNGGGSEPQEIPWLLVGLLAVVLFALVVLLLAEKKKIKLPLPYKKEGKEEAVEEGLTE